ncbi:hypothetical protein [Thermoflexibacter ruber]|uniref:Uncharacterized protein n=1 Tax=Thermoflexibacter ruber TaxID=1003 RepID=A0A1I2FYR0_9BACT|nr:hypothetical protein [Thermoflexibacter ruber]SFF09551.1 hypothetical protein SAMN04488541_1015106 [Thermoflexibacter ruber]
MKNSKKALLLGFALSMAVLSWVYPQRETKAYPPQFHPQQKECKIGGVVVSYGADCIPGGTYCMANPCPQTPPQQ